MFGIPPAAVVETSTAAKMGMMILENAPFTGPAMASYASFSKGHYWTGTFHAAMAISDVFIVKAAAVAAAVAASKIAFKAGVVASANLGLGAAKATSRVSHNAVRNYLKNIGNLTREQVSLDLQRAGFTFLHQADNGMINLMRTTGRKVWIIRLDPPNLGGSSLSI